MTDPILDSILTSVRRAVREEVAVVVRQTQSDELFTLDQAAKYCGVCRKTIERDVANGVIAPSMRKPLRILRSELERRR